MKSPIRRLVGLFALTAFVFVAGCDSEEPPPDSGESELITRVTMTLVPVGTGTTAIASATDEDGDGLNLVIDTLTVNAGKTYTGGIRFEDTTANVDITDEIEDEANDHQIFYTTGGEDGDRFSLSVTDRDGNGLPIGLDYTVNVTGFDEGTATLNVVLSHYDGEDKDGTTRSMETDIEVTFPIRILPFIPD